MSDSEDFKKVGEKKDGTNLYEKTDTEDVSTSESEALNRLILIGFKWMWTLGMLAALDNGLSERNVVHIGVSVTGLTVMIVYHLYKWGILGE